MEKHDSDDLALDVANFVIRYSDGLYGLKDIPYIAQYARVHISYGTIMVMKDKGEIIAVCRWNQPTLHHAVILDFVVHPDYRNKNLSTLMFRKAKAAMPQLETISFKRRKKYPNRDERVYDLSRWIKEKSWAETLVLQ